MVYTLYFQSLKAKTHLTEEEERLIFSNLLGIKQVSDQLLVSLEACCSDWDPRSSTVGDIFLKNLPLLRQKYAPFFASKQPLQRILQSKKIKDAVKQIETVSPGISKLENLLREPLLWPFKYSSFLKQFFQATSLNHPDYDLIRKAKEEQNSLHQHLKNLVQRGEQEAKTFELQAKLWAVKPIPKICIPGRILIKEGTIAKVIRRSGKIKRNYHLFCFNDVVIYATTNRLFPNKFQFKGMIDFFGAEVADTEARQLGALMSNNDKAFKITSPTGLRIFIATESERFSWIELICELSRAKHERFPQEAILADDGGEDDEEDD